MKKLIIGLLASVVLGFAVMLIVAPQQTKASCTSDPVPGCTYGSYIVFHSCSFQPVCNTSSCQNSGNEFPACCSRVVRRCTNFEPGQWSIRYCNNNCSNAGGCGCSGLPKYKNCPHC